MYTFEQETFEVIRRKNQATSKVKSALYRLLEDLIAERSQLLSQLIVKKIDRHKRNAFIIELPEPNKKVLNTKEFEFYGCHVTFDEIYALDHTVKGLSGFSLAHYTEEYNNSITGFKTVIHAYFNVYGDYSYSQFTEYYLDGSNKQNPITHEMELSIINNCQPAINLLKNLLAEKNNRHMEHIKKANMLERQLQEFPIFSISCFVVKEQYKQIANNFIAVIDKLNRYDDIYFDPRANVINEFLQKLDSIKHVEETIAEKINKAEEDILESTSLNEKHKHTTKQQVFNEVLVDELLTKIQYTDQKLRAINNPYGDDPELLIQQHALASNLRMFIIQVICLDGHDKNLKKIKKYFSEIEVEMNKIPSFIDIFTKKCLTDQDMKAVSLLLPYVNNSLDIDFYYKFLNFLIKDESLIQNAQELEVNERKIIEIYRFMLENSKLSFLFTSDSLTLCLRKDEFLIESFIYKVFRSNKFLLFETLLNDGWHNKHNCGIILQNKQIKLSRIILCQASSVGMLHYMVNLLITHKADLYGVKRSLFKGAIAKDSNKILTFSKSSTSKSKLEVDPSLISMQLPPGVLQEEVDSWFYNYSCLEIVCLTISFPCHKLVGENFKPDLYLNTVKTLAENSDIISLLLTVSGLILTKGMYEQMIIADQPVGLMIKSNKVDFPELRFTIGGKKYVSCFVYPFVNNQLTVYNIVLLKELMPIFSKKINDYCGDEFELCEKLLLIKDELYAQGQYAKALRCAKGCVLFLISISSTKNTNIKQLKINEKIMKLYDDLATLNSKTNIYRNDFWYQLIVDMGEIDQKLKEKSIYIKAKKHLQLSELGNKTIRHKLC